VNRTEVGTGPSGPVFFLLLLAAVLPGCVPRATQPPTVALHEVHQSGAHRIAFDPAGRRLASGGLHGRIQVWSVADGARLQSIDAHHDRITGLAWLDDGRLISADHSGWLLVTDVVTASALTRMRLPAVDDLAVSPDGAWVATIDAGGIRKLALPGLQLLAQRTLPESPLALAIDRAAARIAVSGRDRRVWLLDRGLRILAELPRPSRDTYALAFAPDGATLLGGGWFKLLAWQLDSDRLEEYPTEHLGKISSVAVSPDGAHWLSLGRITDSRLLMMDAVTHRVERRFRSHALCGQQARFSPDGRYAASSSDDGSVYIYDLAEPYAPVVPHIDE
jgi:WD40 repeat protein